MSITYTPLFSHQDWVDNVDRVQAGGDSGFNVRFHGIEGEFSTLTTVVKEISDAIDSLSAAPAAKTFTTALTPALTPTSTLAAQQWQHVDGAATMPPGQTAAHGMMGVQLPTGGTISSLRGVGIKASGVLLLALNRQLFANGSGPETVIAGQIVANGPFDVMTNATDQTKTKVDNTQYRYYLIARLDGASAAALQGAELDAIVVTFTD
jgi:hypothetical protein